MFECVFQNLICMHLFFFPFSTSTQRDFSRREEHQQSDVERWLGFITFLCEVFGTMRSSSGEPFRVLVCPIYTCLREVCIHSFIFFFKSITMSITDRLNPSMCSSERSVQLSLYILSVQINTCTKPEFPVFGQT